jgi:hypothetical protein
MSVRHSKFIKILTSVGVIMLAPQSLCRAICRIFDLMKFHKLYFLCLCALLFSIDRMVGQIVINEGCHRNYISLLDEDQDNSDWIELYNAGSEAVDLFGFSLSDDSDGMGQWEFPHFNLGPDQYLVVFCSDKDRTVMQPFQPVTTEYSFVPEVGWNTHPFEQSFLWDGVSNLVINTCSYNSQGYTVNSLFSQSDMGYICSAFQFVDGSDASCYATNGMTSTWRPNMQINGIAIGSGNLTNDYTTYPAPYGNWYYSAKHQFLIRAEELQAAGIAAGEISSLAFDVVATDPTLYDYLDIQITSSTIEELSEQFLNINGQEFHTNFKLSAEGETVYLFDPLNALMSSLTVDGDLPDVSTGRFPNGLNNVVLFDQPTPHAVNDNSPAFGIAGTPIASVNSGFFSTPLYITLVNPNEAPTSMYFTTDGSEPNTNSVLYEGQEIPVFTSKIIRARAFKNGYVASPIMTHSYFFNVNHITPIISVVTDPSHLYGDQGMFDHPFDDWLKPGHVEYFDSTATHELLFAQSTGMIMDGGAGGSRGQPQRSFRLKLADGALGENPVDLPIIPTKQDRERYSDFYLRNGSNQYLVLPYKDAAQVRMMSEGSNNYFSAWRPVSVYVNGDYFGLYELREKFNREKFKIEDDAAENSIEILSLSYFYGGVLRAVKGDVDHFYESYDAAIALNETSDTYWEDADQYFDLTYYVDYICGETWMGNVDWPYNNIKIYRSDATNNRWRFAIQDLELSLQPNGWTDCWHNGLDFLDDQGGYPYTNLWIKSINNDAFKTYFINRFADLMNSSYKANRVLAIEEHCFDQTVVEMQNEYERWGDPWNIDGQMENFYNNHLTFQEQLTCRSEEVQQQVANYFNMPAMNVTLNVSPMGAGTIQISTLQPSEYPWTGVYYNGVPVHIEAVANEGYTFDHWDANAVLAQLDATVFDGLLDASDLTFHAYFEVIPDAVVESTSDGSAKVYPNPARGAWYLECDHPEQLIAVKVFDVYGREVLSKEGNEILFKMQINSSRWATGCYQIGLFDQRGQCSRIPLLVAND